MEQGQLRSLTRAFAGMGALVRLINGFSGDGFSGLNDETRQVALQLVPIFARFADHSRAGTLELQLPPNFVKGLSDKDLDYVLAGAGFARYYTDLAPKMRVAIHALPGEPRVASRTLSPREEAAMEEMTRQMEQYRKMQEATTPDTQV